jgi:hypothetical protein
MSAIAARNDGFAAWQPREELMRAGEIKLGHAGKGGKDNAEGLLGHKGLLMGPPLHGARRGLTK